MLEALSEMTNKARLITCLAMALNGCGSLYDDGYEDAYEERGKDAFSYLLSHSYRDGHKQGMEDFYICEQACSDAENGYPKRRFDSDAYDECYDDCR